MSPIKLLAIFAGLTIMWLVLEWLAHLVTRKPDHRARVNQALEHEQAAHDAFRRAAGRMGRMPE